MDCPSEEHLIRMALRGEAAVRSLSFDLAQRRLVALHDGDAAPILRRLEPLGLGARLVGMTAMSLLALAANAACLVLVAGQRDAGVHMKASYIFTTTTSWPTPGSSWRGCW